MRVLSSRYLVGMLMGVLLIQSLKTSQALANIIGSPTQTFNPVYSGRDFVTVHSARTIKKYHLSVGLFLDQAYEILPAYPSEINGRNQVLSGDEDIGDVLMFSHFNMGLGLTHNWDIGISIPSIVGQDVENDRLRGEYARGGLMEIRVLSKLRVLDLTDTAGIALIGSVGFNRTEDLPYVGEDPGPTVDIEMALDVQNDMWGLAANVGYRALSPGEQFDDFEDFQPIQDTFIASGALRLVLNPSLSVLGEVWMAANDVDLGELERKNFAMEALLGMRYHQDSKEDGQYNVHFGMTRGINHGLSTPKFRAYIGVNYVFGPVFGESYQPPPPPRKSEEVEEQPEIIDENEESFYNEGYRQGYLAGHGVGSYAGLGPQKGRNLNKRYEFPDGYYDGYMDASRSYFDVPERGEWASCYHMGFRGRVGEGPAQGKSKNYGQRLQRGPQCTQGFKKGWKDAPDPNAPPPVSAEDSFYNPGYRQGYQAGYGLGPYAALGPDYGAEYRRRL